MGDRRYAWKRFWCPRGQAVQLDTRGYLFDPESHFGKYANEALIDTARVWSTPCLVLLGEAGSGKSHELRALASAAQTAGQHPLPVFVDLGAYGDELRLYARLFESEEVRSWNAGSGRLALILDSLDEALLEIPKITAVLEDGLRGVPVDRLQLCIACRTTVWPETLSGKLTAAFGDQGLDIRELAPLRRADVELAANDEGLSPERFLQAVEERGVQALALNPTALRLLLSLFRRDQTLPTSLVDLYERGLTLLCEPSQSRRDRGQRCPYTSSQLLETCSRIAAATLLTKHSVLYTGSSVDSEMNDVPVDALVGGTEGQSAARIEVTREALDWALNETSLLSSLGPWRLTFSHRSYAEFLASRWLHQNGLTRVQLGQLLFTPDETPQRVLPQLQETSAWLASMDEEFAEQLLRCEPEVLLLSDVASGTADFQTRLLEALIARVDRHELSRTQQQATEPYLRRLKYPGLAEQIGPIITDASKHLDTRRFAIAVAEHCALDSLGETLSELALNRSESQLIRHDAAWAVVKLDLPGARAKLKPLALGLIGDDPDDELRGIGLKAVWPDFMSMDELLDSLTERKDHSLYGMYADFLTRGEIVETITDSELPRAITWATSQVSSGIDSLDRLAGAIAVRAWQDIAKPGVAEALAQFAVSRVQRHESILGSSSLRSDVQGLRTLVGGDAERRRTLVSAIVNEVLLDPSTELDLLAYEEVPLVLSEDFAWLVSQASTAGDGPDRLWARLAADVFDWRLASHVESWLEAKERCAAIKAAIPLPDLIELDSADAAAMRRSLELRKSLEAPRADRQRVGPPPSERVRTRLEQCFARSPDWFSDLISQMTLTDESRAYSIAHKVTDTPGWKAADQPLQRRIIDAALLFLRQGQMNPAELLGRAERYVQDRAPALAVHLLIVEAPVKLIEVDASRWQLIVPYLLRAPIECFYSDAELQQHLAKTAFAPASAATADTVIELVRNETRATHSPTVLSLIKRYDDPVLAARLLYVLQSEQLSREAFSGLLVWLLDHRTPGASEHAQSLIQAPYPVDAEARAMVHDAAVAVALCATRDCWPAVWDAMQCELDFCRGVLLQIAVANGDRLQRFMDALSDEQIGHILGWLYQYFSPASDPKRPREGWGVHPDESLRDWRSRLLELLRNRGTATSCAALQQLATAHPEDTWLCHLILDAQSNRRRAAWAPPTPEQLLEMARSRKNRFVLSGKQLLDVIVESLNRLQEDLHGITPARADLWNEVSPGTWRPKDENHLSDYVKRHLERDLQRSGIISNREVEIRRRVTQQGEPGERTDVHVNACSKQHSADQLSVITAIIEVKGCWHREIRTAAHDQLVARYMKDSQCAHGLYLVGWFGCAAWDDKDPRKRQNPWSTIDEAREELAAQCDALPGGCDVGTYVLDCALR